MKISPNNTCNFGPLFKELIADPDGNHYRHLRNAIWLYLYLIAFANPKSGKLVSSLSEIATAMGQSIETISSWLGHLKKWHYVSVVKHGNSMNFRVNRWRDLVIIYEQPSISKIDNSTKGPKKSPPKDPQADLIPTEPIEFARHITDTLKASNSLPHFKKLCMQYPRDVVMRAFKEAQAIPAAKIKKSRGALFVYLTKKYAQEE